MTGQSSHTPAPLLDAAGGGQCGAAPRCGALAGAAGNRCAVSGACAGEGACVPPPPLLLLPVQPLGILLPALIELLHECELSAAAISKLDAIMPSIQLPVSRALQATAARHAGGGPDVRYGGRAVPHLPALPRTGGPAGGAAACADPGGCWPGRVLGWAETGPGGCWLAVCCLSGASRAGADREFHANWVLLQSQNAW